jgi:hypothetical protein
MNLWRVENEQLRLSFHSGQARAWRSEQRFTFLLAGTQGGKTSFLPWWLNREIGLRGPGDYIAATSSYDLFKLKFLPEMRTVFEHLLGVGRYWAGEKIIELCNPQTGEFQAKRADDPMWGRIILRSAASKGGLESATAKAAILDEVGQDEFTLEDWEAILRRLSLSQGRVCAATTPYNLGWLKSEVYDSWANGDPDFNVIQFSSVTNPAFPRAEFERARRKMQDWRFAMFYLGQFTRPAGLIYSGFTSEMLVTPFAIPENWLRVVGVDFGGANTATVHLAQSPAGVWYAYLETLEGGKSTAEHVSDQRINLGKASYYEFAGGAKSETQQRMDWKDAGIEVNEPAVSDVESGIDRVTQLIKDDRLRVFNNLKGLRDELGSYSRKLDELGNPTDEIMNKRHYHRLDALRYAAIRIIDGDGIPAAEEGESPVAGYRG